MTSDRRIKTPFYALTWEQAQRDYKDGILTTRGLIFAFFSTRLRPGSELSVDVDTLCSELEIHVATYYRAIGALQGRGRLQIGKGRMSVRLPESLNPSDVSQMCEKNSQMCETGSQDCEWDSQSCEKDSQSCENENCGKSMEPAYGLDFRRFANVPLTDQQIFQINKQTEGCFVPIDREDIGTFVLSSDAASVVLPNSVLDELSEAIQTAGIRPNKTIQQTLAGLLETRDSVEVRRLVENALSALEEQRDRGHLRNPGGFLRAALQRGFTSNGAKKEAREKRQQFAPTPPDLLQLSIAIDQALNDDNHAFALGRLREQWQAGWRDEIEELVTILRPDWGFQIVDGEVM